MIIHYEKHSNQYGIKICNNIKAIIRFVEKNMRLNNFWNDKL